MWWQAVFWILLIPLVIVEIIVFLKTKRFAWLLYALSIFTYVVAVCYTLDVFTAGRNAIILTLLASSALMVLIGRQLGKKISKKKSVSKQTVYFTIGLAIALAILFTLNATGGPATERLVPVASVQGVDILLHSEINKIEPYGGRTITLASRELTNTFWLPLPAVSTTYRACIETNNGWTELSWNSDYEQYPEVPARSTKSYAVTFSPTWADVSTRVIGTDVLLYGFPNDETRSRSWVACDVLGEPLARIPIS